MLGCGTSFCSHNFAPYRAAAPACGYVLSGCFASRGLPIGFGYLPLLRDNRVAHFPVRQLPGFDRQVSRLPVAGFRQANSTITRLCFIHPARTRHPPIQVPMSEIARRTLFGSQCFRGTLWSIAPWCLMVGADLTYWALFGNCRFPSSALKTHEESDAGNLRCHRTMFQL